jgi:hypothetical protein
VQGHVVHVDQMLPQSGDIHFAPVSARVSLQNLDDFLDGREPWPGCVGVVAALWLAFAPAWW